MGWAVRRALVNEAGVSWSLLKDELGTIALGRHVYSLIHSSGMSDPFWVSKPGEKFILFVLLKCTLSFVLTKKEKTAIPLLFSFIYIFSQ